MTSATMLSFTTKRRRSFFVFVFLFSTMVTTSSWTTKKGSKSCAMLLFANAERGGGKETSASTTRGARKQRFGSSSVSSKTPPSSPPPPDRYKYLNRREERFDLDFESDASLKSSATAQNALIHGGITCNGKVKPYAWNRAAKIEDEVPGDVTTIGGSCHAGYADGYGAVSRFSGPLYVAATEDKVFVIDGKNRKVRAIDIAKMTKHAVRTIEFKFVGERDEEEREQTQKKKNGKKNSRYNNEIIRIPGPITATSDGQTIFIVDKLDESIYRVAGHRGTLYEANTRDLSEEQIARNNRERNYFGTRKNSDGSGSDSGGSSSNNEYVAATLETTKVLQNGLGVRDVSGIAVHADVSTHKLKGVYFACKKRNAVFALVSNHNKGSSEYELTEEWITGEGGDDTNDENFSHKGNVNSYSKGGFRDSEDKSKVLFNEPSGIAPSPDGKILYVADTRNNRIRAVVIATGETYTIAGNGKSKTIDCHRSGSSANIGYGNSNRRYSGTGKNQWGTKSLELDECAFDHPVGISVHPDGLYLFVSELHGQTIRVVSLSKVQEESAASAASTTTTKWTDHSAHYRMEATRVSTLVTNDGCKIASQLASTSMGFGIKNTFPDGYGFRACLGAPNDIALAPLGGSLFVVDSFASRVRRVSALTPREKHLADRIKRREKEDADPLRYPKGQAVGWLRLKKPAKGSSSAYPIYPSRYFTVLCEFDQEITEESGFDIRTAIRTSNAFVMRVNQEPTSEDCFVDDDDLDRDVSFHNDNIKCGPTYSITLKAHEPHRKVEIGLTSKIMKLSPGNGANVHGGWRSEPKMMVTVPIGGEREDLEFWRYLLYFPLHAVSGVINFAFFCLLGALSLVALSVMARRQDQFPRVKRLVNKKWFPKPPKISVDAFEKGIEKVFGVKSLLDLRGKAN